MTPPIIIIIGLVLAAGLISLLVWLWSDTPTEGDDYDATRHN